MTKEILIAKDIREIRALQAQRDRLVTHGTRAFSRWGSEPMREITSTTLATIDRKIGDLSVRIETISRLAH